MRAVGRVINEMHRPVEVYKEASRALLNLMVRLNRQYLGNRKPPLSVEISRYRSSKTYVARPIGLRCVVQQVANAEAEGKIEQGQAK